MNSIRMEKGNIISEVRFNLGVYRLTMAPLDLVSYGARVWKKEPNIHKSHRHAALYRQYVRSLNQVIPEALRIWASIVRDYENVTGSAEKGMAAALAYQPAGPAFDARIVGVIRKYWLECDLLNQEVSDDERVSPPTFLLEWLLATGEKPAAEVLASMPYWPVGLDRDGNWI